MDLAALRRAIFARHAHPVSAWSRLLTMPLVAAPFWSKKPAVIAGVVGWFLINPVMTPEPRHRRAFATRAMLGEEIWTTDLGRDQSLTPLNVAGSALLGGAALAAWHRRTVPVALCIAGAMATTVLSWRRYADIYDAEHPLA